MQRTHENERAGQKITVYMCIIKPKMIQNHTIKKKVFQSDKRKQSMLLSSTK